MYVRGDQVRGSQDVLSVTVWIGVEWLIIPIMLNDTYAKYELSHLNTLTADCHNTRAILDQGNNRSR